MRSIVKYSVKSKRFIKVEFQKKFSEWRRYMCSNEAYALGSQELLQIKFKILLGLVFFFLLYFCFLSKFLFSLESI